MFQENNPALTSWLDVPENNDFPIQNLPFGIAKYEKGPLLSKRPGYQAVSIIGDNVIGLAVLHELDYFRDIQLPEGIFEKEYLNEFIDLGQPVWRAVRKRLSELLRKDNHELCNNKEALKRCLYNVHDVVLTLPVKIGDYTDFYSSREHATNVGSMFRDPKNALMPNWLHLPVAYHGRASSIFVSGANFHRPKGQMLLPGTTDKPVFGETKALDFELEMAFVIGKSTKPGESVSTHDARKHIFGFTLFNDWSARDIQRWEYVPLGPFLGKNFASTMSPWIVTLDALEPFITTAPKQEPDVLPYLRRPDSNGAFDINLEVWLQTTGKEETKICMSNFKYMYWTIDQQLSHHTINGCNINIGDLMASGTISGPTPDSYGSMLELTWNGSKPLILPGGLQRKFLEDGDKVIIRGYSQKDGLRIGFGEAKAIVLPAV